MASPGSGISLLRLPAVEERVGIRRSEIYARIALGEFPKQVSLGGRAVAWSSAAVDAWIDNTINKEI